MKRYRPSIFQGAQSRDANEPKFTALLDAYHIKYAKGKPGDGFDLLVKISPMELWEIKNPERSPSARKLTEAEKTMQKYCEEHHIPYRVFEYTDQAEKILAEYTERIFR